MSINIRQSPSGPLIPVVDTRLAPGTVLGNPLTASQTDRARQISGAQLGAILRQQNVQTITISGTVNDVAINDGVRIIRAIPSGVGNAFITGFSVSGRGNLGASFFLFRTSASTILYLLPNDPGSAEGNRILTPGNVPYMLGASNDMVLIQAVQVPGELNFFQVCDRIVPPNGLSRSGSGLGSLLEVNTTFPAGPGGAPDDIVVAPPAGAGIVATIRDVTLLVSTPVVGSTAQLRSAAGGGGSQLSSVLSTAAAGTVRNNDTTVRSTSSGMFLRRSDSGVAGSISVTYCL